MACTPSRADARDPDDRALERRQAGLDGRADRAVPDQQHLAVGQRPGASRASTRAGPGRARTAAPRAATARTSVSTSSAVEVSWMPRPLHSVTPGGTARRGCCRRRRSGSARSAARSSAGSRRATSGPTAYGGTKTSTSPTEPGTARRWVDHLVGQRRRRVAELGRVERQPDQRHARQPPRPPRALPHQPVVPGDRAGVGERGDLVDDRPAAGPRRRPPSPSRRRTPRPARPARARAAPRPARRPASRWRDISATRSSACIT